MVHENNQITIPSEFSNELAEETGIHIGDGSMNLYKSKGKNHWVYTHSGHLIDDKLYRDYVKHLMKKLYNIYPSESSRNNCVLLKYTKKELILFKHGIGLPMSKKINITIPKWIYSRSSYLINCVRGIVDTDGGIRFRKPFGSNLYKYPEIKISNTSEPLINQIHRIFIKFGLKPSIHMDKIGNRRPNILYNVNLNGVKNLEKYIKIFGFSNDKHYAKYLHWKKFGYCLPKYKKNGGGEGI